MNYYDEIKKELINNQIIKKVKDYSKNKSDLNTYYNVGKLLSEAGKHYGDNIIKQYAKKLVIELNKSYGIRNLYNMRLFYLKISSNEILHTLCAISTWSHIKLLLSFVKEIIYVFKYYQHNIFIHFFKLN